MRSPEEAALLVALLFHRAGEHRARISLKTIRRLAQKEHLRQSFLTRVTAELDDIGLTLIENDRGGFGLIPHQALNGAPTITAKRFLIEDLRKLKSGEIDFNDIRTELYDGEDSDDLDDDL